MTDQHTNTLYATPGAVCCLLLLFVEPTMPTGLVQSRYTRKRRVLRQDRLVIGGPQNVILRCMEVSPASGWILSDAVGHGLCSVSFSCLVSLLFLNRVRWCFSSLSRHARIKALATVAFGLLFPCCVWFAFHGREMRDRRHWTRPLEKRRNTSTPSGLSG